MIFNQHSDLEGQHAFLGASKYSWLNYDQDKLALAYKRQYANQIGTVLHDLAHRCIKNRVKLSKSDRHIVLLTLLDNNIPQGLIDANDILETLVPFVNDALGFRMESEQVLYYSDNAFGTADVISFKNNFLRIHDYKSGTTPVHMDQLRIYAALFCLEYVVKPENIKIELRIYQSGEVLYEEPEAEVIRAIMNKIVDSDKFLRKLKEEER
jgi:hypothetical protein